MLIALGVNADCAEDPGEIELWTRPTYRPEGVDGVSAASLPGVRRAIWTASPKEVIRGAGGVPSFLNYEATRQRCASPSTT